MNVTWRPAMDPTLVSLVSVVAALFLEEPPLVLAEGMVRGQLDLPVPPSADGKLTEALDALRSFARARLGGDAGQLHRQLRQEFAGLFVGPQPRTVHPYESFYRDSLTVGAETFQGLLMGESVDKVRAFWAEAGVHCINPYNYPPDHIGLELAFVAYMGRGYLDTGEERYLELTRRFLEEHLLTWVPEFCAELYAVDTARFYKPVAQLAEGLLAILAERLDVGIG
ncbi:MAG: hypothetical protein CEE40_03380 [Chloroflexi bacterium B3_Chlor]|nr:MAG: hypothetical protein CEE40_03380 [Chloroflexi bacterium B3_Chlor]